MSRGKRRITRYSDWFALLWGGIIGYLSLAPLSALPEIAVSDKLEHFAAYSLLGFLAVLARRSKHGLIWIVFAAVAYGGAIEIIQPYVNRYMELGDFIANACGALFGATLGFASGRVTFWNR
jgi:VanZ family protein